MRVAVLGAAGTIARAVVRDLAESDEVDALVLLDRDGPGAEAVAADHARGIGRAVEVDARQGLAEAVEGCAVLVNAASYRLNLEAMQAALAAGCHYLDLGGLYWMTARQLELDRLFSAAGLIAVIGMGASPGKTNVMARRAVRELGEQVAEIHVSAAGRDPAPARGLRLPYALRTLIDELTMAPVVWEAGRARELAPLSPGGWVDFPAPIGRAETIHTLHSEIQTLPASFGLSRASFRLSLPAPLLGRLEQLTGAGEEELEAVAGLALAPSERAISAHVVEAVSARRVARVSALTRPMEAWGMGGGIVSTAAPAAAAVRLIARGRIEHVGVAAPETCVDPDDLLPELERRGATFQVDVRERRAAA